MYFDQIHIACYPLLSPHSQWASSNKSTSCHVSWVRGCVCVLFTGSWMRTCLQSMCVLPVCTLLKNISVLLNQSLAVCKSSRMCGPHKLLLIPWQGPDRLNLWKSWLHNCGFYELKSSTAMTCVEVSIPHPYPCFLNAYLCPFCDVSWALKRY